MKYFYPLLIICLIAIISILLFQKQQKSINVKTLISDIKFTQDSENSPDSKITYKYYDQEKKLPIKNFVAAGAKSNFYDFNNDGINEVVFTTIAGANHLRDHAYRIKENGDLENICAKDYKEDENNLGKESQVCYFYGFTIDILDYNNDGYLDIITSARDFDTNMLKASIYRIYLWSQEKDMFVRN